MSDAPQRYTVWDNLPGVQPKDETVIIDGLNPILTIFLRVIGDIHMPLFGKPCVVTSAKDGKHGQGSKHYTGDAVDLRIVDKEPYGQVVFLMVVLWLAREAKLAVFDESNVPGAGHVHVEVAG